MLCGHREGLAGFLCPGLLCCLVRDRGLAVPSVYSETLAVMSRGLFVLSD